MLCGPLQNTSVAHRLKTTDLGTDFEIVWLISETLSLNKKFYAHMEIRWSVVSIVLSLKIISEALCIKKSYHKFTVYSKSYHTSGF